jgi:argininosuccinate lyase
MGKKLWGGRFGKQTDPLVEEFTKSIQYDQKLATYDLIGSRLHVEILRKSGYLSSAEAQALLSGLAYIDEKIETGSFAPGGEEDIHTYIQNELQKKVGDLALKLQTARSRNDQVTFATKLYAKASIKAMLFFIAELEKSITELAEENVDIIIPGFTHMQHAQPVRLKDYLWAYVEMLERDYTRLDFISKNMRITLGAGALAGTPINASEYNVSASKVLKHHRVFAEALNVSATSNSLDSVSDRDFVIEIISALSMAAMHLSRMAEDLIIWSTEEFDFVEIDEAFCTGSSLMPQKKNADSLELVRGYTGRLYGNLVSVLTMMKGLPLTYNRDMQLDKEPLFSSFEIVSSELRVLQGLVKTLKFNREKIQEHLEDESLYATDLVYYLVDKKVAFKQAHTIVGRLVKCSLDRSIPIKAMPEELLKSFSDKIVKKEIVKLFDPLTSVESKRSVKR